MLSECKNGSGPQQAGLLDASRRPFPGSSSLHGGRSGPQHADLLSLPAALFQARRACMEVAQFPNKRTSWTLPDALVQARPACMGVGQVPIKPTSCPLPAALVRAPRPGSASLNGGWLSPHKRTSGMVTGALVRARGACIRVDYVPTSEPLGLFQASLSVPVSVC